MEEGRKRILEQLKNGDLTVEEASKQLEQLEHGRSETKDTSRDTESNKKFQSDAERGTGTHGKDPSYRSVEKDPSEKFQKKLKSASNKLTNIFDQAVNKMKEMDLDFYNSVEVDHVFQQNDADFTNAFIEIPNGEVTVNFWDASDVRIECKAKVYREDDPDTGKKKFLKEIEYSQSDGTLLFKSKDKFMKVYATIYLPEKMYQKIGIKLFNGPISCESVQAEKLDCNTTNGKIRLTGCTSENGEIETVNGQVTVVDGNFGKLEVETVNGKVNTDGKFQKLDVETIGGTIVSSVKNTDIKSARIRSMTGSVYVKLPKDIGIYGELKSYIGNLQVDFSDILVKQQRKEFAMKHLVFEKVSDLSDAMKLNVQVKTGSVFIQPL